MALILVPQHLRCCHLRMLSAEFRSPPNKERPTPMGTRCGQGLWRCSSAPTGPWPRALTRILLLLPLQQAFVFLLVSNPEAIEATLQRAIGPAIFDPPAPCRLLGNPQQKATGTAPGAHRFGCAAGTLTPSPTAAPRRRCHTARQPPHSTAHRAAGHSPGPAGRPRWAQVGP